MHVHAQECQDRVDGQPDLFAFLNPLSVNMLVRIEKVTSNRRFFQDLRCQQKQKALELC